MDDLEFKNKCEQYNGDVGAMYYLVMLVFMGLLIAILSIGMVLLNLDSWWLIEILGGSLLAFACLIAVVHFRTDILDNLIMFWREDE